MSNGGLFDVIAIITTNDVETLKAYANRTAEQVESIKENVKFLAPKGSTLDIRVYVV